MLRWSLIIFSVLVFGGVSFSAFAEEGATLKKEPYRILLKFYDQNENAITYHRYCIDSRTFPPAQFIYNANYVSLELQNEMQKAFPKRSRADIEEFVLKRGDYLQRKYTQTAFDEGCYSLWANAAKKHYEMFTKMETDVIKRYIENRLR